MTDSPQDVAPVAKAPPARTAPGVIIACVLMVGLGLFVVVHVILQAQHEMREDEKVELVELDEKTPVELEVDRLKDETERLQREKEQLQKENLQLEERYEALSKRAPAMPLIETFVASAEGTLTVGLSAGSSDKVERGFQFAILRDKKVIGRVVADVVGARACACRIVLVSEGERIRVGDIATTKLN